MTNFDPDKHRIVAVVVDPKDVEHGQHFHLSLPELVQEVREVEAKSPDLADVYQRLSDLESRQPEQLPVPADVDFGALERQLVDSVARETDPHGFLAKRLEALEGRLTETAARLDAHEQLPHISEDTIRQLDDGLHAKIQAMITKHVNGALGDVRSRLVTIERNTTTAVAGADPDSAKLAKLAEIVSSLGEYMASIEKTVEEVDQKYAELVEYITDTNLKTMTLSTRLYRALKALEEPDERAA